MTDTAAEPSAPLWRRVFALALCGLAFATFIALGTWQLQRLEWKQDLIAAVDARAFGPPQALPRDFRAEDHAYLRARVEGTPMDAELRVKALTELGPGDWVMSPLETRYGILWVNRGFVPSLEPSTLTPLPTQITGLLRPSEPEGTLLESNDPEAGRWVSRDTLAMSEAVGLGETLDYFIDADHTDAEDDWPRGGMTIITFRNTHLTYALTWYAMAALLLGAVVAVSWPRNRSNGR
ncbi:MAG: SURF1 family protein [Pseudomonadota bacterium]